MSAFGHGILMKREWPIELRRDVAAMYVDTCRANIEHFLSNKTKVLRLELENPLETFDLLWSVADFQGNREAALAEWSVRHNARTEPGRRDSAYDV